MDYDALLNTASTLGLLLTQSGAENFRVEDSLLRFCHAYGAERTEIFAIPSLLIVSICDPEGHSHTRIRRIFRTGTNLGRVDELNALCRRVCRERPDFAQVDRELAAYAAEPGYPPFMQLLGYAFVAAFFTPLFGGGLGDGLCALAAGAVIWFVKVPMDRLHANGFFVNAVCAFFAALTAVAGVRLGVGHQLDKIVIGAFMGLVPGVAITNFMRDILSADYFSGIVKLSESLLTATAMALGAGIALACTQMMGGVL